MTRVPLHGLWERFRERSVEVLVLRDFESLPAEVASDLDIAVRDASQRDAASEAIRQFARDEKLEVVQLLRRSYVWEHEMLAEDGRKLIVDLHFQGEGWRGPLYLTNEELFASAVKRAGWLEPAPHHQAMMAVFQHLLWGRFYKDKYHTLVPLWIAGHEDQFRACVTRAFGSDLAPRLVEMILSADANGLAAMVPLLRRRLWQLCGLPDLAGSLARLATFIAAEIRLTLARSGRWVVLVGPDGVGKTTVAALLAGETKDFFRGVRYHHWIPRWQEPLSVNVLSGGAKPPLRDKSQGLAASVLSTLRLTRNIVRAHLAYGLRILPHLFRQRLVIGDRYLFNYVLDPRSVRYHGPAWLACLALRLAPGPDLVLCLEAPAEEIHRRKPELSVEEIQGIMTRCRELSACGFLTATISAAEAPGVVAQAIGWKIIRTLKRGERLE